MGWLHGAMLTRQPFTLSVYVHASSAAASARSSSCAYRRMFTINRGAEQRGRVPDFDRYVQEHEFEAAAGRDGLAASRPTCSGSPSTRRCAPAARSPTSRALAEAVDFCAEAIESAGDCKVSRGEFHQQRAVDQQPAARARRAAPRRASTRPPTPPTCCRWWAPPAARRPAIPFAFADPGPHRRAAQPLRRGALQPHHADRRAQWLGQDDDRQRAALALPGAGRARVRDRPRRPLRDAHAPGRRRPADRDRRRRLPLRAEPVGRRPTRRGCRGARSRSCSPCTS